MTGLALGLASSLCWGISDFLGGLQSRRVPLLVVMLVSQWTGLVGLLVLVALRGKGPPEIARLLPAALGGTAGLAALAAFYRGLAIGTMSIVAPISATGVAVPVVVGVASGERPGGLQLVGLAAAVLGVVLASREGDSTAASAALTRTSIALALVAALGFGSFFVGLRISARADVLWALVAARVTGCVCLLALAARARVSPAGFRRALPVLVLAGLLDLSANATYALATKHGLLSVVAVAASLYPLATVILARIVLGERVRRVQELGIVAALAGIVMIAAG